MTDLNRASLIGRLGKDPEIRSTQSGEKVASFRLATGEKWKDKASGEDRERTEWHTIVIWGPLVRVVEQYLTKGKRVMVEGAIRTRKRQDQSGNDRYSTEIVLSGFNANLIMLDGPQGGGGAAKGQEDSYGGGSAPGTGGGQGQSGGYGSGGHAMDDEIPFAPELRA